MRSAALFLARLAFAAVLLAPLWGRAMNIPGFALTLAGAGMPFPGAVATLALMCGTFGPAALVLGAAPRITAAGLALSIAVTELAVHRFWTFDGAFRQAEQAAFCTAVALMAGLVFYAASGPGDWSWHAWRRGLGRAAQGQRANGTAKASARPRTGGARMRAA